MLTKRRRTCRSSWRSAPPRAATTRRRSFGSRSRYTCEWGSGGGFDVEIVEERDGFTVLRVDGAGAERWLGGEAGGHRWQRVPPSEKRGRVHTSTVTVVVLPEPEAVELELDPRDLVISTCRASGDGGQHLQKTESAVQVKHLPTGLIVRCENERSQHRNRASALAVLRARLFERARAEKQRERVEARRSQAGSGQRGDKRRTVRCRDGVVTDHVTGQRWSLRDYLRGEWELAG